MFKKIAAAALAATMLTAMAGGVAQAQTAQRVYENGTVWRISYIETKPGMFDQYLTYLKGAWRASNEAAKKVGDVVSYKVMVIDSPHDGGPNLMLAVEYKNMAVFDRSAAEQDRMTAQIFGSVQQATQSQVSREAMRTQRGTTLTRELKFVD